MINHSKKQRSPTLIQMNKKINTDVLLILKRQALLLLLLLLLLFYFSICFSAAGVYKLPQFNILSSSVNIILLLLSPILSYQDLTSILILTDFSLASPGIGFPVLPLQPYIVVAAYHCFSVSTTTRTQGNLYSSKL